MNFNGNRLCGMWYLNWKSNKKKKNANKNFCFTFCTQLAVFSAWSSTTIACNRARGAHVLSGLVLAVSIDAAIDVLLRAFVDVQA